METKQPKALTPLFLTEVWERFGFYVTQSLLILYLIHYLNFSDPAAFLLLGEFTALAYLMPLAGGWFADRIVGPRYAILLGALCLGIGYFLLGLYGQKLLFLSLSSIVIGSGLLKPNVSSFLGEFYHRDDPRRSAGFTLFYIGINIGSFLATGSAGFIQEKFGWHAAFFAAALGMSIAFVTFLYGFRHYENRGLPIARKQIAPAARWLQNKISVTVVVLFAIGLAYLLLHSQGIANILQSIVGVLMLVILIVLAFRYEKKQRKKLFVLIILILASIAFWGVYFQIYSAVALFTDRNVDRHLFGVLIPTPTFMALQPIFIIVLGPFLAWLWEHLHIKKRDPSSGTKFAFAMLMVALAMQTLVFAIHAHRPDGFIAPGFLLVFYVLFTLGEMLLSPIGLSMVTELSPPHLTGLLMGVWFMALGFGGQLSGYLAKQASIPKDVLNIDVSNHIYLHAFSDNALFALVIGIILLILSPILKRLANGK